MWQNAADFMADPVRTLDDVLGVLYTNAGVGIRVQCTIAAGFPWPISVGTLVTLLYSNAGAGVLVQYTGAAVPQRENFCKAQTGHKLMSGG